MNKSLDLSIKYHFISFHRKMIFRCSKFRYLIYFVKYALISPLKNCSWEILVYIHTVILENLLKKKKKQRKERWEKTNKKQTKKLLQVHAHYNQKYLQRSVYLWCLLRIISCSQLRYRSLRWNVFSKYWTPS